MFLHIDHVQNKRCFAHRSDNFFTAAAKFWWPIRAWIWKPQLEIRAQQQIFLSIISQHIPTRTITLRTRNKVWMTSQLHHLSRKNIVFFRQPNEIHRPRPGKNSKKCEMSVMLLFKRQSENITTSFVRNWTSKNQAATTGGRKSSQWQICPLPKRLLSQISPLALWQPRLMPKRPNF